MSPAEPAPRPAVPASPPPESPPPQTAPRVWKSSDLLGSGVEALIEHGGVVYRLRRTRQGKLILHK